MVIAVDFDGTLCENEYPNIGQAKNDVIEAVKRFDGVKILWTCRGGEKLKEAVVWCKKRGLTFDYINESVPEWIERYGGDSRKVGADIYLDDRNVTIEQFVKFKNREITRGGITRGNGRA